MPMTIGNSDTLYIRIGEDKIVFARYDHIKDSTLNYSCYKVNRNISLNANMHQALDKMALAKGDFSRVYFSIDCKVTLVPLNDFDDEEMEGMYEYNIPDPNHRLSVFYDMLPLQNATMLGSVEKDLEHTILEAYPNATFHSAQMPLVLHLASLCQGVSTAGKMFVLRENDKMIVAAFRDGKLSFLNSYGNTGVVENAMYYILSLAKQWNINVESDEVYLVGLPEEGDTLQERLKTYLPNTFQLEMEKEYNAQVKVLAKDLPYDMIALLLKAY